MSYWASKKDGFSFLFLLKCLGIYIGFFEQAHSENSLASVALLMIAAMLVLSACGGGSSSSAPAPAFHNVTISWSANHEKGVNVTGGGYKVSISGQTTAIDVPFNAASGVTPTSTIKSLYTGSYTATVKAYAALDSSGGTTGSTSAASSSISIVVP